MRSVSTTYMKVKASTYIYSCIIEPRCDVETFLCIGHLYANCAPREKQIDMHINLLRRGEFRDVECVKDIER
jgi:hypothetical protein